MAWDPSPDADVVGYVVHYGVTSGSYPNTTNVNSQTAARLSGLQSGQTYYFAVTARDALGMESVPSNEVSYQVPVMAPPTVTLTSPLNGAAYPAPALVNLAASVVTNGHTITKVQFYSGATLLGEDTSSPYSLAWTGISAGSYSLTARLVYDAGSTLNSTAANVTVTNQLALPAIVMSAPATGTSYSAPANINLAASVTANGHTITKVQFYNGAALLGEDTSLPYSYPWSSVTAGSYSLTARLVYDAGSTLNSTAANVTVTNQLALPAIVMTSPATGSSYTAPATVNLAANVTANGHTITKVQFYNGAALLGEDTSSPYSYPWSSVTAGSYSLTARAVYDSGSTVASAPTTVSVTSATSISTLWPNTAVPTVVDAWPDNPVELGVRFRSDVAGSITGIRFYKSTANTGTHVGNLWSGTGALLASATFTSETALGWQQVLFATPVAITADTVYVASYHAQNGHYSADLNYFSGKGQDNGPLHALADGVAGPNGVFAYGDTSAFPDQTWSSANYWVDVSFQPDAAPTLTSIAVTPGNPTILFGATQQFTATGTYSDGSTQNLSSQVTWASSSPSVANVNATGSATALSVGNTTVSATLAGKAGNTLLTVQAAPVILTLTSPSTGLAYSAPATINCAASVTANGHTITKVQFYNGATLLGEDTSAPYSCTWGGVSAGSYSLTARVVYDAGSTLNSAATTVTVTNSALPTIALTSPLTGAAFTTPTLINLAASVTANGHTITKVQFYTGTILLGEDTSSPYSLTWTGVNPGSYGLKARVVYDAGSTVDSATATVTVTSPLPTVALTSPTNGTSYTAPANINLAAGVTANGHTITKVQFYNGATLLGEDTSSPYSFTWGNVAAGSYSLTARVVYDAGSTLNSGPANVTVTSLSGLPAPWLTADIGAVGLAGNASESSGLYTVQGAGNISGRADNFRFVYQTLSGNGDITARINSMATNGPNRCVGVMIRESLAPNSRYAFMGIGQNLKFRWQRRSNTGGTTSTTTSVLSTPPNAWARLVRTNDTLYGYSAANGVNWTKLTSISSKMATNIYVGFVVASGDTNTLNTSVFSNVSVTP